MKLKQAYHKYKLFGGCKLLKEYYQMGVLSTLARASVNCIWHRQSLKSVYPIVTDKIDAQLKEIIWKRCCYSESISSVNTNRKVWFCWLQGMETAPEMVKVCYESICRYMPEREVEVIDESNFSEYVNVPEFIERNYHKGIIPAALFTDILRLELLIKYGGTWIDSTVLMTDPEKLKKPEWLRKVMVADLFMFQYYAQDKRFTSIGNWFITSCPEHWVLKTVRDTLYEYWQKYDCVVDYYIFHRVIGWIAEERPEVISNMPRIWAVPSLYLRDRLAMDFDDGFWQELTSHVCLHKLNYRKESEAKANSQSFWNKILSNN